MIQQLIETFRPPSANQLAQRELEEAERDFLRAKSSEEYAANMARYHLARIQRLRKHLAYDEQINEAGS